MELFSLRTSTPRCKVWILAYKAIDEQYDFFVTELDCPQYTVNIPGQNCTDAPVYIYIYIY